MSRRPRTRVIYFRVSEQEFSQLCSYCEAEGHRSMSELVRVAVGRMLSTAQRSSWDTRMSTLDAALEALSENIEDVTESLRFCSQRLRHTHSADQPSGEQSNLPDER